MRSRSAARLPAAPPPEDAVEAAFHAAGERAPWEKVWSNGCDVTDEGPATWPWPWSAYYAQGWRPLDLDTHVCTAAPAPARVDLAASASFEVAAGVLARV